MKPFDIEAAKRGEPVCTADGREVKLYAFDFPATQSGAPQPVIGVYREDEDWVAASWSSTGRFWAKSADSNDLRMATRKETRWVVTWKNKAQPDDLFAESFYSEKEAIMSENTLNTCAERHSFSINAIEVDV
ncbi:MAG: hypothetical protein E6Q97_38760 [Desulfurellales bacterium]|nr:MAG: hypothetical protein E6Q97_38760 [Desulfurellales bacterium]